MKKGISLIAVLMFMLAATTASVVVYKWIGSENFASGSRLKQSEAYQASEAGLDAVYAWLSYKAPDVGAVVKDFLKNKQPYELTDRKNDGKNNVLGGLTTNPNIYFKVYLTSVDASNIRKIKLKFLSEGVGRDGSKVQQTAIYSVNGLYNLIFEGGRTKTTSCTDYDEDFWGNMGTVNEIESARAVVTQDASIKNAGGQALNKVTIGTDKKPGYLVLDGNYYANHGIDVYGDVYSTGDFDFCSTGSLSNDNIRGNLYVEKEFHPKGAINITGDAYLKGGMNPNKSINNGATGGTGGCAGQASGGVVSIGGNSTIQGNFNYWNNTGGGGLGFSVAKNLVMDNGIITLTRSAQNSSDSLAVYGNVYIKNTLTGTIPTDGISKPVPLFGGTSPNDTVCVPGSMAKITSNPPSYCSSAPSAACFKDNNNIQIRTKASNVQSSCTPKDHWYAKKLDYLKDKLSPENGKKSCEFPPIQFDISIYEDVKATKDTKGWVHRKDKPGSCEKTARCGWESSSFCNNNPNLMELAFPSYPPRDIAADLQNCYNDTKNNPDERHLKEAGVPNSGWLVTYIKDEPTSTNQDIKTNASKWGGNPTPGTITSGKYIIIYELSACNNNGQCFLYLPPTARYDDPKKDVEIMLYLPKGFPGRIELAGTPKGKSCSKSKKCDDYNYFIFSDGDINQFDATDSRKLHGNIFMNKCAVMNHVGAEGNGFLTTESNSEFVKELMKQGVLCMYEEGGENCAVPNPNGCKPPSTEIPPKRDDFFVPISPRLRVDLENKYISKESVSGNSIEPSVLVMPRIIRFNQKTDALPSTASLKNYYNYLYLNYSLKETKPDLQSQSLIPTCDGYDPTKKEDGIYECKFTNSSGPKISPFYLQIHSGAISEGGYTDDGGGPPPGTSSPSGISSSSRASSSSAGSGGGTSSDSPYGGNPSSASYAPWCSVTPGCYDYPIPVPQYGCGGGLNSEATAAKFKYTSWRSDVNSRNPSGIAPADSAYRRISPTDVKWNRSPPEPHSIGSYGRARDIYMYDIRCDGERIILGTDTNFVGIKCGSIDWYSNCDYTPWCRVAQTCFTGTSVPASAIEYGCGYGTASFSGINPDSVFRYNSANGDLSTGNKATDWVSGGSLTISARTTNVFMYNINCDGNIIKFGMNPNEKSGMLCEGTLTTGATSCPSSSSRQSSSSRASSSSAAPSSSAAACAYQASWCNGDYPRADRVPTTPNTATGNCFFVSDISKMQGASLTINGTVITPNNNSEFACGQSWAEGAAGNASCSSLLPAKKDGGYYMYIGSWISNFTYTTGSINCGGGGGTPSVSSSSSAPSSSSSSTGLSVTCTFAKGSYTVNESVSAPSITCSNGSLDKNSMSFNFTGISPMNSDNWKNNNSTSYTGTGTSTVKIQGAKCNNTLVADATCTPTLTIAAAPSSSSGGGGGGTTIALPSSGYTSALTGNVTLTCTSQMSVGCYANPAEDLNIGCAEIKSYSTANNATYIGECGSGGQGGSINCTIPAGKTVYCKKNN